jgi:hypothetical protein
VANCILLLRNAEIALLAVMGPGAGHAIALDFPIDNVVDSPAVRLGIKLDCDGAGFGLE